MVWERMALIGDNHLASRGGEKVKETSADRRSVTMRPEVDMKVRDMMASSTRYKATLDYTKALNLLAELGAGWLENSNPEERKRFRDVISKYIDYDVFENSVLDEWAELGEFRLWKAKKARREIKATS
jgi:hypothetical protein